MSTLSKARRKTYQAARIMGDVDALASGNPRRMARRAKNVALGRAAARGGFWRMFWGR